MRAFFIYNTSIVHSFYLFISIFIINLYQFLMLCSLKVLLFVKLYFSKTLYLLISHVSSGSSRLSLMNEMDAMHYEELSIRHVLHYQIPVSVPLEQSFLGCFGSAVTLIQVTDSQC